MGRNRARRFERRLRQERAHAARILAFPRAKLHDVRRGKHELDEPAGGARKHQSARGEWLERRRNARNDEAPARFRDAMQKIDGRRMKARGIAQLGKRDERTRNLRGRIKTLLRIEPNAESLDQTIELRRR